jgi:cell division protease FtsH
MFFKRMKLWWMDNRSRLGLKVLVWSAVFFFIFGLWAFFQLDSYAQVSMLAQFPVQLYMSAIGAIMFVYLYSTMFSGALGGMKKNIWVKPQDINVRFSDVIGLDVAKKEAMEVVELLKDRKKLKLIGGNIIKGLILFGPPGTGKTLLAKAIATTAELPFLSMSGSDFVEIFVGVGASRVRQLFERARILADIYGGCIVFIDEIDALGQGRKFSFFGSAESDSTLNQLLVQMDGVTGKQSNVVVIAATNAKESILDAALLRPGRFDRKIYIDNPNLDERVELFRFYLKKVKHDPALDVGRLGRRCVGKSPADIMNIVKESALIATRDNRSEVTFKDISAALERIDLGAARQLTMTSQELEATAYHEVGHLVTVYQLHPTNDVFKASIVSRGGALGVVWHSPREELHSQRQDAMVANIKVSLAGYVAEKIKYGVTTTGVSQDFTNAMNIAHAMVWNLGMGASGYVGNFSAIPGNELSNEIRDVLSREVQKILSDATKEVEVFLKENWAVVERFVQELLKKNELEYDEIHAIFAEYGKARNHVPLETVHPDAPEGLPPSGFADTPA